jgi:hypothetical protein
MTDQEPLQAAGSPGTKGKPDGVGDTATHGLDGASQSDGGAYPNPHTGKEARGESPGFKGGQTEQGYYGKGQFGGEKADPDEPGVVGQGGRKAD